MVMIIRHIDAIAREKQRDVLYLEFHPQDVTGPYGHSEARRYDPDNDPVRRHILQTLDEMGIAWMMCGEYADVWKMSSWRGQIYLDVPFDATDPVYCRLRDFLEYPDGTIRHEGVRFYVMPLSQAMKNAEHDEPGFWERWAENF